MGVVESGGLVGWTGYTDIICNWVGTGGTDDGGAPMMAVSPFPILIAILRLEENVQQDWDFHSIRYHK